MKYFRNKIRWLVVVVALMAMPAVAEVRDTIDFDINDRTLETITIGNETFSRYSYPDCDHIDQTGAPMLPVKYIRLSVPYNATNITVTGAGSWTSEALGQRIYPAPVPLTTDDPSPEEPELVIDSAIYMTNAYWPASPAELVGEGFYMGENHIVTVAVYPMLYNPGTSQMRNYSQVRVTISYNLGGTPANMLVRYDSRLRQKEQQQTKSLVANPQQVEAHAMPASTIHLMMMQQNPDTTNWPVPGYEYMVITTRELVPAFKRLIALKQQKGYRAGVVCIEDIVNDTLVQNGDKSMLPDSTYSYINDDAGKVREYLKENMHYGTKYVLIGGKELPYRYGWNESIDNQSYTTEVPTDLYYSELTTNWNKDNDNLYGEKYLYGDTLYYKDFDFYPELYVGRLLCNNQNGIKNYTKKLLNYEMFPGHGDYEYLRKAFYYQYSSYIFNGQANSVHSTLKNVIPDSTFVTEYRPAEYPKGKDIIDLLNNNYGFISLHTHGNPGHMVTSYNNYNGRVVKYCIQALDTQNVMEPHSWQYQEETGNGLDNLLNKTKPTVLYTIACSVTPFDVYAEKSYSPPYVYHTLMNFGESFTLGNDYGGVALLGNTRSGIANTSKNLEVCFAKQLANDNIFKVGIAEALSKFNLSSSFYRLYVNMIHNLIGEPEFDIWTDEPQRYTNLIVNRNTDSITISGFGFGNNTYVGISDGNNQRMDSTVTGSITLTDVNPNSTIMVYQHNFLPYIAPLYLQNERVERSQYVIAHDVFAGRAVDSNRAAGDLTIVSGSKYEIENKGQVILASGFKVEKGALFSVTQSDY